MERAKTVRCAIYTRKSSEEGLEQEFNSLDAQREACEAYIVSQKHEGWKLVKTGYNDGGFSGGTLERPGLKHLLDDIERGVVDVVVVYKVDRLTRSLLDFAKIVERFDQHKVSFVAVTQHFNTTSSMGRLTLNVLLSFAQFEREVTGERIRDKIAASKKKGMWMGGPVPLGYDLKDRKLLVNVMEAERVRTIYERYLEVSGVSELVRLLQEVGIRSKSWVSARGIQHGGNWIVRGALYLMLQNRIYLGEIVHKENSYPGEHDAIVPMELWTAVQKKLIENRVERSALSTQKSHYLLEGILYDELGQRMVSHYSMKKGNRYRYYVASGVLRGEKESPASVSRVSANIIESVLESRLTMWMRKGDAQEWKMLPVAKKRKILRTYLRRIELSESEIKVMLRSGATEELPRIKEATTREGDSLMERGERCCVTIPYRLVRHNGRHVLATPDGQASLSEPMQNATLIRNLAQAFRWRERLESGDAKSVADISRELECTERYVHKLLPLAFLAPDIVDEILDGRQPAMLTLDDLTKTKLPLSWEQQRNTVFCLNTSQSTAATHSSNRKNDTEGPAPIVPHTSAKLY